MSMLLNSYILAAAAAAGLQYVGGLEVDGSSWGAGNTTVSLSGTLTGGLASSPQAGDFCIVGYSQAGTADRTARAISNAAGAFTSLMTQYVNDTNDTSITIKYKFLESPIDYDLIMGTPSSSGNGVNVSIQVFRGVNVSTPFDVAEVTVALTDTALANPGAITPVTAGAIIGTFAACAMGASISTAYTSSDYDAFTSSARSGTNRSHTAAFGRKAWTSGAFNAAVYGGPSANVADSCIAVAFALRPA